MATRMGLTLSPYQALETDPDKLRQRHKMLAEYVALEQVVEKGDLRLAPAPVRRLATRLAALIKEE
jgi:hypothetical protein